MLIKNGGGDHKRQLSRVHYICTMHCVQCTLEKQCTAHHVINQFSDSLPLILNIWKIFNCHWCDFLSKNYENVGECSQTNVATFECGIICGNRRYWEGKSQQLALMPAGQSRANASRSTLVGSRTGSALSFDNQLGHQGNQTALIIQKPTEASLFVVASRLVFSSHDDTMPSHSNRCRAIPYSV